MKILIFILLFILLFRSLTLNTVNLYQKSLVIKENLHLQDFSFSIQYLKYTAAHILAETLKEGKNDSTYIRTINNILTRIKLIKLELTTHGFDIENHINTLHSGNRHNIVRREVLFNFGPLIQLFSGATNSEILDLTEKISSLENIYNENISHTCKLFNSIIYDISNIRKIILLNTNTQSKDIKIISCTLQLILSIINLEYRLAKTIDTLYKIDNNEISHFLFYKIDSFMINKTDISSPLC